MKTNIFPLTAKYLCLCGYLLFASLLNGQALCINDTIPPVPHCKSDFSIEVFDSTITNVIHAKELNDGSFDDCTPSTELRFAFSENPNDTLYYLPNGPAIGKRRRFLKLFVFDKNGLFSYHRTSIVIYYLSLIHI